MSLKGRPVEGRVYHYDSRDLSRPERIRNPIRLPPPELLPTCIGDRKRWQKRMQGRGVWTMISSIKLMSCAIVGGWYRRLVLLHLT